MTIRNKALLTLGAPFLLALSALLVGFHSVVLDSFSRLEERGVRRDVTRVLQEISDTVSTMESVAIDWAEWDDTYQFVRDRSEAYTEENLTDDAVANLGVDAMLYLDAAGDMVALKTVDRYEGTEPFPADELFLTALLEEPSLSRPREPTDTAAGLLMVGDLPTLLVSHPILHNDGSGPVRGALILGRYLHGPEIDRISGKMGIPLDLSSLGSDRGGEPELPAAGEIVVRPLGGDLVAGYAVVNDVHGVPGFLLRTQIPRDLYRQGLLTTQFAAAGLVTVAVVFAGIVWLLLGRIVLNPLARLTADVASMGEGGTTSLTSGAPVHDELGQLACVIQNLIATQRQHMAELRHSEERYRAVLGGVPDPVVVYDPQGNVTFLNDAFVDTYGWTRDEVSGKRLDFMMPPEEVDASRETWRRVLAGEDPLLETRRLSKDGRLLTVQISSAILRGEDGEHRASVVIHRDVTALRVAENKQRELELRAHQTQRLESLGVLAGGIAHDFNNILGPIVGFTEMAMEDIPEESQTHENLERVVGAAERARDLVRQILVFSRENPDEAHPVRVHPIVKETLKLLRASLPSSVEIQTELSAENDLVMAGVTQLHQVVMNLAANAGAAMESTGGVLTVATEEVSDSGAGHSARHSPAAGRCLQLTVRDTGSGIDPSVIGRVFDPFFTTKEVGKGSGMGLSVAHGIVDKLGGTITVDSAPGTGATFRVRVPLLAGKGVSREVLTSSPLQEGEGRVLLVDDEEQLIEVWSQALPRLGYEVTACGQAEEALDRFREDPGGFDVVVTDQTMPGMTGVGLARELLRIREDLPILLCTGLGRNVTREQALAIGIQEYLIKPVTAQQMGEAIQRTLYGHAAR